MNTQLFTNVIKVNAKADQARQILANPTRLLRWVPEINAVDQKDGAFSITRSKKALNQFEVMTVEATDTKITYHSRQGRLAYDLVFELTESNGQLQIRETLFTDPAQTKLPLKLLASIGKQALKVNLVNLERVIETLTA